MPTPGSTPNSTSSPRALGHLTWAFLLAAIAWNLGASSFGWFHAIADDNGWRQTQTAISTYFIQHGGPWLAYETPVLGPPWALPHEFPIYEIVVATLSSRTGIPLEQSGRLASLAFFYAALPLAFLLLADLGVARSHRPLTIALWALSPLYVFWSRTFMIDSTAMFFSVAFLTFFVRSLKRPSLVPVAGTVLAGATAYAMKPPTLAGFVALAGLLWLRELRQGRCRLPVHVGLGGALVALPIGIGSIWHSFGDAEKRLNPFGWAWTSKAISADWILSAPGTNASLGRRFEPETWSYFWHGTLTETLGHQAVLIAALLCVLVARRRRTQVLSLIAVAVAQFLLFAPLYLGHPYYQYCSGVFLVAAVGLAATAALECGGRRRLLAGALTILAVSACLSGWWTRMMPVQRRDAYRKPAWFVRLGAELANVTRPADVIVGFGMNWDPEVPYYARRRALMWPAWANPSADGKDVATAIVQLNGLEVGALFNCSSETPETTLELMRRTWHLADSPVFEIPSTTRGRRCVVFARQLGDTRGRS